MSMVSSPQSFGVTGNFLTLSESGRMSKAAFARAVYQAGQTPLEEDENFDVKSFMTKNRFEMFDQNNDGVITTDEACSGCWNATSVKHNSCVLVCARLDSTPGVVRNFTTTFISSKTCSLEGTSK